MFRISFSSSRKSRASFIVGSELFTFDFPKVSDVTLGAKLVFFHRR